MSRFKFAVLSVRALLYLRYRRAAVCRFKFTVLSVRALLYLRYRRAAVCRFKFAVLSFGLYFTYVTGEY